MKVNGRIMKVKERLRTEEKSRAGFFLLFLVARHNHQHIALVDCLAFADAKLFDGARDRGREVVFHFHCFEHDDGLAAFDGGSSFEWDPYHKAGHGGAYLRFSAAVS